LHDGRAGCRGAVEHIAGDHHLLRKAGQKRGAEDCAAKLDIAAGVEVRDTG